MDKKGEEVEGYGGGEVVFRLRKVGSGFGVRRVVGLHMSPEGFYLFLNLEFRSRTVLAGGFSTEESFC